MRLTLRTLLAYLDDILDPSDREQLMTKIESSEFANDLIHRTRDTMRRLRLSAPQPLGTGMALDPNTVAEYLDNVLPPDAVGDFERICLESDVHLAEVASCHHVLTMVLGEPAAIDPDARQRMYTIAADVALRKQLRIEPAHIAPASAGAAPITDGVRREFAASAPSPAAAPITAEVPDYLRTSVWARYRGLLVLSAAALLVAATVYFASGLTGWFAAEPQPTTVATTTPATPSPPAYASSSPEATPVDQSAAASSQSGLSAESSAPSATAESAGNETAPSAADATPPSLLTPGMTSQPVESSPQSALSADGTAPAASASAAPYRVAPETPDRYGEASVEATEPADGSLPPLRLPAALAGETERFAKQPPAAAPDPAPRIASATGVVPGAPAAGGEPAADANAPIATPEAVTSLGTYLGGKTVLLRFDEQAGTWLRLQPRTVVSVGDKLLALPVYRPRITLSSGVDLELVGGTLIKLSTTPDSNIPMIEVVYGRIVLVNVDAAAAENHLQLAFGTTVGDAQLAPNATLAVEVERVYVPGQDPRQTPAPVVASLYAPNGNIVWMDGLGTQTVKDPGRWTIADGKASAVEADLTSPEWVDRDPAELLSEQRHGAPVIEQSLMPDRPIDNQLLELYQGSGRREVKSLAARCSVHVGLFVPFIEALRDSDQKSVWRIHIETLRSAMALSPESAENIWKTLVEQRGDRAAADLYEMLCGFNEEQIGRTQEEREVGAIAHLIDRLEDDNLDYRVLAVHNLREITGKTLMPNPAGSPNEREQGIRHWRTRLRSGELAPQSEP